MIVFALWVNVDEWFLLGPVLVTLFWLGERLQGQRQTPGWLVPAGLVACLLNPHTFHAFTLPPELSLVSWTSGLRQDIRFQPQFASPWQSAHLHAAAGLNAAALAYFALTFLGLASFLLPPRTLRSWRLVVWLPFALLAAWQVRLIPFFAVVAAPITAINWQDFLVRRLERRKHPFSSFSLRPSSFLVLPLLALILLTWPGWLAGYGREERRVAWGLQADPSLQQVTETLHDWRRQGLLPAGERVLALSPEVAQYGAWFSPGEKYFFDHRYPLFSHAASDYETVCRAVQPGPVPHGAEAHAVGTGPASEWRKVLREHGVGILVFYDHEPERLFAVLRRLAEDPEHWTLLNVAGQALIVGWNPARPPGAFAPLAFNPDRLAFGAQDARAERELSAAPEQGPEHLPSRRALWARLIRPASSASWESTAATVYLHEFDDSQAWQGQEQFRSSMSSYAASLVGLLALPPSAPKAALQLVSSHNVLYPRDAAGAFLVREFNLPAGKLLDEAEIDLFLEEVQIALV